MVDVNTFQARRWNLGVAGLLNGEGLPRTLNLDANGTVLPNHPGPAVETDLHDIIVFPALVNSHDHLDFSLYPVLGNPPYSDVDEWAGDVHKHHAAEIASLEEIPRQLRRYWGLLKNLMCGVTTVMDHREPAGDDSLELPVQIIGPYRFVHRADSRWSWFRARMNCGAGPLVFHVGEGSSEKVARRSATFLRRLAKKGPLVGIHGIKLETNSAVHLDALVWCPVSNRFLFEETADVATLKAVTEILFGTDSGVSAGGTIWDHLRVARESGGLSDAELLDSVTTTASRVWCLKNNGDFVIARRRHADLWESFFSTTAADICAVFSQQRLVLIGEDFHKEVNSPACCDSFRTIRVGDVLQRIRAPSETLLTQLASLQSAPLSLA